MPYYYPPLDLISLWLIICKEHWGGAYALDFGPVYIYDPGLFRIVNFKFILRVKFMNEQEIGIQ